MIQLTPDTTVRDLLTQHPATFSIFEGHSMCESCKTAPPPVPLHHFANRHGVDLQQLIGELGAVIGTSADSATD